MVTPKNRGKKFKYGFNIHMQLAETRGVSKGRADRLTEGQAHKLTKLVAYQKKERERERERENEREMA
jgi:hypothetical protein